MGGGGGYDAGAGEQTYPGREIDNDMGARGVGHKHENATIALDKRPDLPLVDVLEAN